jgi:hypothetical protein
MGGIGTAPAGHGGIGEWHPGIGGGIGTPLIRPAPRPFTTEIVELSMVVALIRLAVVSRRT